MDFMNDQVQATGDLTTASFNDQKEDTRGKSLTRLLRENVLFSDLLPYERFRRFGAETLTDSELLAVLIRTGTRHSTPLEIGHRILSLHKGLPVGLNALHHLSLNELMELDGVGEVKAVRLKCAAELARRMNTKQLPTNERFHNSADIAARFMERLRHEEQERVLMLSLNTSCMLISETLISIGTVNQALLSPREVFRQALKTGAVMIVLIHNHPGGDPTPSGADLAVTKSIQQAGVSIGIKLVDHIIIGDHSYTSFLEQGLLKED